MMGMTSKHWKQHSDLLMIANIIQLVIMERRVHEEIKKREAMLRDRKMQDMSEGPCEGLRNNRIGDSLPVSPLR